MNKRFTPQPWILPMKFIPWFFKQTSVIFDVEFQIDLCSQILFKCSDFNLI